MNLPIEIIKIIVSYGNTFENHRSLRATCRAFWYYCHHHPPVMKFTWYGLVGSIESETDITPLGKKHGIQAHKLSHGTCYGCRAGGIGCSCWSLIVDKYHHNRLVSSVEVFDGTEPVTWAILKGISDPLTLLNSKTLRVTVFQK